MQVVFTIGGRDGAGEEILGQAQGYELAGGQRGQRPRQHVTADVQVAQLPDAAQRLGHLARQPAQEAQLRASVLSGWHGSIARQVCPGVGAGLRRLPQHCHA